MGYGIRVECIKFGSTRSYPLEFHQFIILKGEQGQTRGKRGSDLEGRTGIGLGVGLGVGLGGRTKGRTRGGRTRWLVKFPKFHFDLLTCHLMWTSSIQRVLVWVK